MVIDLQEKMKKRFYRWAAKYVKAPDIKLFPISEILAFLVERRVFTIEEIRSELDKHKIILHEDYFELAKKIISEKSKEVSK